MRWKGVNSYLLVTRERLLTLVVALVSSFSCHAEMREDGSPFLRYRRHDMIQYGGADVALEVELVRAKIDPATERGRQLVGSDARRRLPRETHRAAR